MINIASVMAVNQPGVLVLFIQSWLLSVVALREMLGMASAAAPETSHTERLMRHDAYRRNKGRMVQIQWSA